MNLKCLVFVGCGTLALSGCQSGDVTVQDSNPSATHAPSRPVNVPQEEKATMPSIDPGTVYFSHVSLHDGHPERAWGISFLPWNSESTVAFGIHFSSDVIFSPASCFGPVFRGVDYLSSDGSGHSSVSTTDISTLATKVLKVLPSTPKLFAASGDGQTAAWVDTTGAAYALNVATGKITPLDTHRTAVTRIRIAGASGLMILTLSSARSLVFERDEAQGLVSGNESYQSSGIAVDAAGDWLAWPQSGALGMSLTIYDRLHKRSSVIAVDDAKSIFDLAWIGPHAVAYVAVTGAGSQEVRVTDTQSLFSSVVSPVNNPLGKSEGIICPVGLNDTVFYANYSGAQFSVYRATRLGDAWTPALFAGTDHKTDGYVCPQISQPVTRQ